MKKKRFRRRLIGFQLRLEKQKSNLIDNTRNLRKLSKHKKHYEIKKIRIPKLTKIFYSLVSKQSPFLQSGQISSADVLLQPHEQIQGLTLIFYFSPTYLFLFYLHLIRTFYFIKYKQLLLWSHMKKNH